METIAVYWESKVRTYGFHVLGNLSLCPVCLPVDQMAKWGAALTAMADQGPVFRMVWAQLDAGDRIKFYWLCDDKHRDEVRAFLHAQPELEASNHMGDCQEVDLVFFQGPHFGDRYGIMDFTYKALARAGMVLMAAVCSVATIYLVVPAGQGDKTKDALTSAFEIPKETTDRRDRQR